MPVTDPETGKQIQTIDDLEEYSEEYHRDPEAYMKKYKIHQRRMERNVSPYTAGHEPEIDPLISQEELDEADAYIVNDFRTINIKKNQDNVTSDHIDVNIVQYNSDEEQKIRRIHDSLRNINNKLLLTGQAEDMTNEAKIRFEQDREEKLQKSEIIIEEPVREKRKVGRPAKQIKTTEKQPELKTGDKSPLGKSSGVKNTHLMKQKIENGIISKNDKRCLDEDFANTEDETMKTVLDLLYKVHTDGKSAVQQGFFQHHKSQAKRLAGLIQKHSPSVFKQNMDEETRQMYERLEYYESLDELNGLRPSEVLAFWVVFKPHPEQHDTVSVLNFIDKVTRKKGVVAYYYNIEQTIDNVESPNIGYGSHVNLLLIRDTDPNNQNAEPRKLRRGILNTAKPYATAEHQINICCHIKAVDEQRAKAKINYIKGNKSDKRKENMLKCDRIYRRYNDIPDWTYIEKGRIELYHFFDMDKYANILSDKNAKEEIDRAIGPNWETTLLLKAHLENLYNTPVE